MNQLKIKVMDIMGFCLRDNYVFNADTLEPITVNNKLLICEPLEGLNMRKHIVFDLFDSRLISSLFKAYLAMEEEEENLYIMTFYEEVSDKLDQFSSSRLVLKDRDMNVYTTEYYYMPSFKYIAMLYQLSEMFNINELNEYDSKDLVIAYYEEQEKLSKKGRKR